MGYERWNTNKTSEANVHLTNCFIRIFQIAALKSGWGIRRLDETKIKRFTKDASIRHMIFSVRCTLSQLNVVLSLNRCPTACFVRKIGKVLMRISRYWVIIWSVIADKTDLCMKDCGKASFPVLYEETSA